MGNHSFKQGFLAHWLLCRLLGQNQPINAEIAFQHSSASWPHHYALNSFYLGFSLGKNPKTLNWKHLGNINLIKRMTRGDKGRGVFITRINFYLLCPDTPVPTYWCVLVGKTCAICAGGHQHHRYLCELSKGDKNLTLSCRKGNRWCKHSHTHTQIHTFSWHKVTTLLKLKKGYGLEWIILDSPQKLPGKGLQQVRSCGGTGDEPHTNCLSTNSDTPVLLSSSLSTSMHISRAPTDPTELSFGTSMAPTQTKTTAQHPQMLYLRTYMQTVL